MSKICGKIVRFTGIFRFLMYEFPVFYVPVNYFPNYPQSRKASHRLQSSHLYDKNSLLENLSLARILLFIIRIKGTESIPSVFSDEDLTTNLKGGFIMSQSALRKVLFLVFIVFSCMTSLQNVVLAQAISVTQGETVTLTLKLVNVGDTALQKVHVQLDPKGPLDWIQQAARTHPAVDVPAKSAVDARPSAMLPFTFTVDRHAPVDTEVSIPLRIYDGRGDVWTKIVQLRVIPQLRPRESRLLQNYPNPFNPETWLPYQLAVPTHVMIYIYDFSGHLVRTLDLGLKQAGFYTSQSEAAYWDGRNESGERISSGLYIYRLQAEDFSAMQRMVIVK